MFDYEKVLKETNIEDLNKEITKNPNNDNALYLRGCNLMAQGESKWALANFISTIQARVDFEESLNDFNSAINVNKGNSKYFLYRAFIHNRLENFEEVLDDLDQYVDLEGQQNAFYYEILGNAYYGTDEFDSALDAYSDGLEVDPNNVTILYYRAYTNFYRDYSNYSDALLDLNQLLKLDENHINARYLRARGNLYQHNFDQVISDIDFIEKTKHNLDRHDLYYLMALSYHGMNMFTTALDKLYVCRSIKKKDHDVDRLIEELENHLGFSFGNNEDSLDIEYEEDSSGIEYTEDEDMRMHGMSYIKCPHCGHNGAIDYGDFKICNECEMRWV